LQARPFAHWPFAVQQVAPVALQQTPFSHLSPAWQVPWPGPPVHAVPVPVTTTQCELPSQPYPAAQSGFPPQVLGHVAAPWAVSDVHAIAWYAPQSRAAPAQALSSSTVRVAQMKFSQTASRRVPWQVVVEVVSEHSGAERNGAGQSAATPQQLPVAQQNPLSQWPETQLASSPGVQGWPFVILSMFWPEGREQAVGSTTPPARSAAARTR
jgi:hypothetical protein